MSLFGTFIYGHHVKGVFLSFILSFKTTSDLFFIKWSKIFIFFRPSWNTWVVHILGQQSCRDVRVCWFFTQQSPNSAYETCLYRITLWL